MSNIYDKHGIPTKIGFTDILFGNYGARTIRQRKARDVAKALWAAKEAAEKEAAAKEATKIEPVKVEAAPAADAIPVADAAPLPPGSAEAAKSAESASTWTAVEDAALIGLKAQSKSWAEIGTLMGGKDKNVLRERYKELTANTAKEKVLEDDDSDTQKNSKEKEDKQNKEKDAKEKDAKRKDAKGKDAKGKDAKGKDAKGKDKKGNGTKEHEVQGILKKDGKGKHNEQLNHGEPGTQHGRPMMYTDEDDQLTIDDMMYLVKMKELLESVKWVELASKLFDKTGKRVTPDLLERKLKDL